LERRLRRAATGAPASVVAPALAAAAAEPEEAVVATAVPVAAAAEIPPWPGETDEASFLADARLRGDDSPAPAPVAAAEETGAPADLPPLEQLVARIPAEVREALDDLFRAKFTRVRRVSRAALKP
jgi:hypothetical protein